MKSVPVIVTSEPPVEAALPGVTVSTFGSAFVISIAAGRMLTSPEPLVTTRSACPGVAFGGTSAVNWIMPELLATWVMGIAEQVRVAPLSPLPRTVSVFDSPSIARSG